MGEPMHDRIATLCRELGARPELAWTLESMGELVGASPAHLQRSFKALVGVSPRDYHQAQRLRLFKTGLRTGDGVLQAQVRAGYGSSSRLHAHARRDLGMTPSQYGRGGRGMAITHASCETALGSLMVGASERGLCFLQLADDRATLLRMLRADLPHARLAPMPAAGAPAFEAWMEPLQEHLAGRPRQLELPLDLQGTALQLRVWRYLQQIPAGQTRSYGEVAAALGRPSAARAIARACASNRIAVLVPCHRVLRADGGLGGYRWGLSRKRALLRGEGVA